MKKNAMTFFLMFSFIIVNSQKIRDYSPQSPQAMSFNKMIDLPVSKYTGIPGISIPIFTIEDKELKLPITINYNSSGVKVEEIASWVGLGWNLNFGGGVFRQVRGLPDDVEGGYLNEGAITVADFISAGTNRKKEIMLKAYDRIIDLEPDVFNFNILGYSGKFFFKQDTKEIVFFKKENILVEPVFETEQKRIKSWKFTLPNGVVCFFGQGKSSDLNLSSVNFSPDIGKSSLSNTPDHRSAWYISRIEGTNGNFIEFSYDQYSKSYCSLTGQEDSFGISSNTAPCSFPRKNLEITSFYSSREVFHARIKEISTSTVKVSFISQTSEREDLEGDKALEKIIVYDKIHQKEISSFDFEYEYTFNSQGIKPYPNPCSNPKNLDELGKRLFLKKILQTKGSKQLPPHEFFYNTRIGLPARTSFSQDFWGFYNGESNSSMISEVYINNVWTGEGVLKLAGAKKFVDKSYSKAGILEKIKYPTGGTTEFVYENNKAVNAERFKTNDYYKKEIQYRKLAYVSSSDLDPNDLTKWIIDKKFTVPKTGCKKDDFKVYVRSRYKCNNKQNCLFVIRLDGAPLQTNISERTCILLSPGEHTLTVELYRPPVNGEVLEPGFAEISTPYVTDSNRDTIIVGSQRIKEIKFKSDNKELWTKKYEYENGELINLPVYTNLRTATYRCNFGQGGNDVYTESLPVYVRKSNSYVNLSSIKNGYVGYQKVVEYTNEKTKNGYQEHIFSFYDDKIDRAFPFSPSISFSWKRGNLLQSEVKNASNKIVKKTKLNYFSRNIFNQKGVYVYNDSYGNIEGADLVYKLYDTHGESFLQRSEEKSYLFSEEIKEKKNFAYENLNYEQPSKITTTDSRGNVLETKMYYSYDKSQLSGLSAPVSIGIDSLKHQNRIATPIQIESYRNNVLQSTQRTNYKYWPTVGVVTPETIQTSKGTLNLEGRIVYKDYDNKGNPLEISKADGTSVVYIWGYQKTQPIAKIENATYSEVQSYVSNLQTLSNADNDRTVDQINNNGTIHYKGKEGTLRSALNALRTNLPNAQITTFTYDPLIGVTSITDARGNVMYYVYDSFNRLQYIKDKDGYVLKEHKYHYKN